MSNIVTLKINLDDSAVSGKAVANAVRRAFGSDTADLVESGEVKGVRFSVRPVAARPVRTPRVAKPKVVTEASIIRAWAREAGVAVGKRGRIHPEVKAAYQAVNVNSETV